MNRRELIAGVGAGALSAVAAGKLWSRDTAATRGMVLSTAGCGRATGYAEASKIVTLGARTHVTWLDAEADGFRVRIRTLDRSTGRWSETRTVGEAQDNHGGPALTVDGQGYLHIVYYPHHQSFRYRRSQRPNDASEWESEILFGEGLSYPVLLCGPDDTLYLSARRKFLPPAGSKDSPPWELEWWKKPVSGPWRRERAVLRSRHPNYTHFQESLAWGADHRTIHLACRIYETTGVKDEAPLQTIGYLVSPDAGVTWRRVDGTVVALPATAATVDVIERGGGASGRTLYSGSVAVDRGGRSHRLLTVREKAGAARTYVATPGPGAGWTQRDLHAFLPERYRDWDLVSPGAMTFSASGRVTIVATLAKLAPGESDWAHATNDIVRFWSDDGALTFRCEVLDPGSGKRPRWLPNLERPTGHHSVPDEPGIIFTAGSGGAGLHERLLNNEVCWWPANG